MFHDAPYLDMIKTVTMHAAPGMPLDMWWVTALVLAILVLAATIDAFTSIIPEALVFAGLIAVTATQGMGASWQIAAHHLRQAVVAGLLIWAVNAAWYMVYRRDALGMGDAKWTMLAVACFGVMPALYAWGLGAIFACVFIGAARLAHHRVTQVTFGPFLLVGLCMGLWWVRFGF
jgi:prepilin signal peptidase PulO-like enzyme (type II secretory pathway)